MAKIVKPDEQMKALIGACEMLHRIARGEQFSTIEFMTRLESYKRAAVAKRPELATDGYWGQFFAGRGR